MSSAILRMIALSSVLVHLWAGCGRCCVMESHQHHAVSETRDAMVSSSSHSCCSHGHCHESPRVTHEHENAPCQAPCDDSRDCCTCVFTIPGMTGGSSSVTSKSLQPMITLASISLILPPEFSSRSAFSIPSPEDIVSDPRSLRARIAVFLL